MAFGIAMYLRDTSLKFQQHSHDMTRATLGNISKTTYIGAYSSNTNKNPYEIDNPYGGKEDITWLL
jgi:hypothetical protein